MNNSNFNWYHIERRKKLFLIIQILQFQERDTQTNVESNSTLSIPSLDLESEIIPSSSRGDVQTRKKRGHGNLDKSSIISSNKRSKQTQKDEKYLEQSVIFEL